MTALDRARNEVSGGGYERAKAWAALALAEATERLAVAAETQAAIAQYYFEANEGMLAELSAYRPTAEVRSPLLSDVEAGADDGARVGWLEVRFFMNGERATFDLGSEEPLLVMAAALRPFGQLFFGDGTFSIDAITIKAAK